MFWAIFKYFLTAFFSFSAVFLTAEIILFYSTGKFTKLPGFAMLENFLRNMMPGLFSYFNGPHVKTTEFFIFTAILLSFCLIFGLGMFAGFVINLKIKNSSGPAAEFADTKKSGSHRY